jgi:very-short-patch-repair endonuclease
VKQVAITARSEPSEAERELWFWLKEKGLNYKFRLKHPMYGFVVDFWCAKKKLVIEVDREWQLHDQTEIALSDARTQVLSEKGISVMRLRENEVLDDSEAVIRRICSRLRVQYHETAAVRRYVPKQQPTKVRPVIVIKKTI